MSAEIPTVEENYTLPEMARLLRISESSLYSLRYRGLGPPAARVGKKLLFPRASYVRWLAEQLEEQAPPPVVPIRRRPTG
jgi:hypothetical protein